MGTDPPFLDRAPESVVLYVEDKDAVAYLFQKALDEAGARLRLFRLTDGEQGIAFLLGQDLYREAPRPDLVILDINLPMRSGFEVLITIRKTEALKALPVVMFSSSTSPADKQRAYALGADKFFLKDGSWEGLLELAKAICSMLSHKSP
jgi:CheY-like chemotaxis protein